jgi:hypothetical protein
MGWFGGKDWNVLAIIFERPDLYRVNANRVKGGDATTARDNVKVHSRTICWAVFDQKRGHLEGGTGPGLNSVPTAVSSRLIRELPTLSTVREILETLEKGTSDKVSKALVWNGYPKKEEPPAP